MGVLRATSTIFLSVILGALVFAYMAVQFPDAMESVFGAAGYVRGLLVDSGLVPAKYNVWVMFLVAEQQLVFLGFVILMRILMAMVTGAVSNSFGGRRGY